MTLAPTSSTPEETEFRPGMSLVTKLILNGLITVGCAVMVAGTTIWSSFAFSSALGDLSNAATTLATSAQNAGAANPDLLAAVETATESAQAAVVRTRILVVLAVALACVLIMTPMAIVIVGVRETPNGQEPAAFLSRSSGSSPRAGAPAGVTDRAMRTTAPRPPHGEGWDGRSAGIYRSEPHRRPRNTSSIHVRLT